MRLPSMESSVIPLAQLAKVGLYIAMAIALDQFVKDFIRNQPPGVAVSLLVVPYVTSPLLIELIASECLRIKSRFTWNFFVLTSIISILISPVLFFIQPGLALVITSLSSVELLILNDNRIRANYKVHRKVVEFQ